MRISAGAAKQLVHSGTEVAFLDIREAFAYGEGHPLFAVPCPYSRFEHRIARLVPRLDVPVVLIDDGDGVSERAEKRLADCGYTDIRIVGRGMAAWRNAGFSVYAGVNVPSKTLGEILEHDHHPDFIDAPTLARWMDGRAHFRFFDARPPEEFRKFRIEGARCLPNGELAHRLDAVADDDTTPIVVTCAGRTRGILGVLGLRAAGVRNPVYALENGTQGWALAGFTLDRGASPDPFPELDAAGFDASRRRAMRLKEAGVSFVSPETASRMLAERTRTTFLFDLRTADEQARNPCPGATPVLGGQLVQATDQYVGVRHARLILVDDTGLRAALAALFLTTLGFEPHVVALDDTEAVKAPLAKPVLPPAVQEVDARQAMNLVRTKGARLLDLRASADYETSHLAGAAWTIRPKLDADIPDDTQRAVLFGEPDVTAAAALDLAERGIECVVLADSPAQCKEAGWTLEAAAPFTRERAIDRIWFTHSRHDGDREASLRYLAWEIGLMKQLDPQERAEFRDLKLPA